MALSSDKNHTIFNQQNEKCEIINHFLFKHVNFGNNSLMDVYYNHISSHSWLMAQPNFQLVFWNFDPFILPLNMNNEEYSWKRNYCKCNNYSLMS